MGCGGRPGLLSGGRPDWWGCQRWTEGRWTGFLELHPGVVGELDARQLAALTQEMGARWVMMGWPCPPYSTASRATGGGARDDPGEREAGQWLNTGLISDVLERTFGGRARANMPQGILLENMLGLLRSKVNAQHIRATSP